MFIRILAAIILILAALFVVDWLFLRNRAQKSLSAMWDTAPILGFFGAVLLALAFAEAARREAMDAWRWSIAFGLLLSACAGIAMMARAKYRVARNESGLRGLWRIAQTYGLAILFGALGVVIAVRVIGAALEVFIAGALGLLIIAIAVGVFVVSWRKKTVNSKR
jgi:MFS family permease